MNPLALLVAFMLMGDVRAIVELNCSDNATCIDHMAKEIIRSLKQQKSVKVFNVLTIEPIRTRQARSKEWWLTNFLDSHAFSFDWNDYTFKVTQMDGSNALDLEIYEGRTAKDVSDPNAKKSSSKKEEEKEVDKKSPKMGLRKKNKKKVMQVIIPLLFGMKSAGIAVFAMAIVTMLTLKAFLASKVALLVTGGMAMKKLYETYGSGVGLQNHPYLYSQYPIDFPSASSHAYSVNGVSPQFASPEMYSPTALGAHAQMNEIIHQSDATAQQSQQAPTLLVNSTRAAERWDGKSKLLNFLEPIIDGVRYITDPIADALYEAMPATFRGLSSHGSKAKRVKPVDDDLDDELEIVKKPRKILVPQPRNIAHRKKSSRKNKHRPKKYSELKVSLDRLKHNKDLHDYIKTKKYKYNYPSTYFYPRVKYFVNPNSFYKINNSRLMPYKQEAYVVSTTTLNDSDWKPIIMPNHTFSKNDTEKPRKRRFRRKHNKKRRVRPKRSIYVSFNNHNATARSLNERESYNTGKGFFDFFELFFATDLGHIIQESSNYAKSVLRQTLKSNEPGYYTVAYNMVMMSLDVFEGLINVNEALENHFFKNGKQKLRRRKFKNKLDNVTTTNVNTLSNNCTRHIKNTTELKTESTTETLS